MNTILYECCLCPGIQILFVCPRLEQARVFSNTRLTPAIEQSPLVRRILLGKTQRRTQVLNLRFANDSALYVRAAFHSAAAARGISADLLLIDEFQDAAAGDLPVLQETLSHSPMARTILTGTPKTIDNHLEAMYALSNAQEWLVPCESCGRDVLLDESLRSTTIIIGRSATATRKHNRMMPFTPPIMPC